MAISRFTEIRAWQSARVLTKLIYEASESGPLARDFVLRDQLRRASISVMSNIAEGFARRTDADFSRFLDIARASANEVQSLLILCGDTSRIPPETLVPLDELTEKTISQIARFQDYLRNPIPDVREDDDCRYTP
jgi:four helix bundle protein